jgi:predicted TIM-barrel fold metal-dependent hydrolase
MNLLEQPISRRALVAGATGLAANLLLRRELAAGPAANDAHGVWDAHTHLSSVTGDASERIDKLLAIADRMGIQRLVVFMGLKWSHDPTPADMRQQNDEVIQAVTHSPHRVLGFVYLNPKHVEASLAEMDRCIRHGPLVGVKLWVAMHCNEPALDPIVRRAVELKVPLLQHTYIRVGGNIPGESTAADVAQLAARHPDARFICAHVGNDWEQGIRAIRAAKNVWAETSGSDPTAGMVEMAVRELGPERVIYGSDAGGRSYASQLAKVESADLSEADRQMILGGNLRRLLADVLATKGMTS